MRPIIFLDIDGVLNTARCYGNGGRKAFDAEALAALDGLVAATSAEIVVSSTWRLGMKLDELEVRLRERGFGLPLRGMTPDLSERPKMSLYTAVERGREIAAWLDNHFPTERPPFAILDDDDDMCELTPFLVQTSFDIGLTAEQAERARVALLGMVEG